MTEEEVKAMVAQTRAVAVVLGTSLRKLVGEDPIAEGTVLCLMLSAHCANLEFQAEATLDDYLAEHIESVHEMLADIQAAEQTAQ